MDTIVIETNRYAEQTLGRHLNDRSRYSVLGASDSGRYLAFSSIFVLQGIIQKPQQCWYWNNIRILETPILER